MLQFPASEHTNVQVLLEDSLSHDIFFEGARYH